MTLLADPICITVWTTKCTWSTYWLLYYAEGRRHQRPVGAVKQSDSLDLSSLTFQSYVASSWEGNLWENSSHRSCSARNGGWSCTLVVVDNKHLYIMSFSQSLSHHAWIWFNNILLSTSTRFRWFPGWIKLPPWAPSLVRVKDALLVNLGCDHLTFSWWRWLHVFRTCTLNTNSRVQGRCPVIQDSGWCLWKPHGQNP